MVAKKSARDLILLVIAICLASGFAEDLIWYQGSSDYYTGHRYGWQGTTDGKSAPDLLLASIINQPWLVTISKSKNEIYWTDNKGVIGAWNGASRQSRLVYQFNIGNWDEGYKGPALTGIDVDELNNHLYFTFNRSIYRLDLSRSNPSPLLIASYDNLVFNPRFSASRNSLFFCIRNNQEQGDLVQVSLSDPTTLTTLVHNTSTGSIVQQLFIDDSTNTLYYDSPGTLTMRGVSLTPPFNQIFSSIYLNVNPTFFDFNPARGTFVLSDLKFSNAYLWSLGPNMPTKVYSPSSGSVAGVKFFNDTHVLVTYKYPGEGKLVLVNINDPSDTSVLLQNFGMGTSLIFDEKYCNFYYVANPKSRTPYLDQLILRKYINSNNVTVYQRQHMASANGIAAISLDVSKRNLIVARAMDSFNVINYFPIDQPNVTPVPIIDSQGRSIRTYAVNDKTGDIFYTSYEGYEYNMYRLDAASISKDWINNVGRRIIPGIYRLYGAQMAIDSVNSKLYYTDGMREIQIVQANFDGSARKNIFNISNSYNVQSMMWDPTSERLFILATPNRTWHMMSMKNDGSNVIYTSLNYSSNSGRDLFMSISPDPFSDWVYMNAEYYQPIRIKKDGSAVEKLYSYIPFNSLGDISFDEQTGNIYFSGVQCVLKSINIKNINYEDPVTTPVNIVWQGDAENFSLNSFYHDRKNQMFWLLLSAQNTVYPYSNYTVSVTPVNGGPTKQLFNFTKNIHPPWIPDVAKGKMFAYSYYLQFAQQKEPAIVVMDLYNGSNLRTIKEFKYPQYSQVSLTAMTLDTRTGLIYYSLKDFDGRTSTLECFDPVTFTTKTLYTTSAIRNVRDMKFNGTSLILAGYYGNVHLYDTITGVLKDLNTTANSISLDPKSNTIYLAGGSIRAANINDANATQVDLLSTIKIKSIAFDFNNKKSYFSLQNLSGRSPTTPPYYYQADLDGNNKKKMQIQNAFYVPSELGDLSLVGGKFYSTNYGLDTFNLDGSGFSRIFQNTYATGNVKYDEASQRVFWQEDYGIRLYSCAVYSKKFADCEGTRLLPILGTPMALQLTSFAVGNGMVYFTARYQSSIYSMDLKIGQPSFKKFVTDPRLASVYAIAMNKSKSELFVTTVETRPPTVLRVSLDGIITTLYSNVTAPYGLLVTDLTHCK